MVHGESRGLFLCIKKGPHRWSNDGGEEREEKSHWLIYSPGSYILYRYHLQVPSSNLISNGLSSLLISLWHRKQGIRLPASFSSVTERTCLIFRVSPLSLKRSGWGVPSVSKWARTEMGVERIFMVCGLLILICSSYNITMIFYLAYT